MKILNKQINIAIICILLSIVSINAQTKSIITHVNIDNKKNGAFVKLFTTSPVDQKHITGWSADDGWFYITVLNAIADSGRIASTEIKYPVSKIQVNNADESAQIAFKINEVIENFEFYQSKSPPEILLSLRFPIHDMATVLKQERANMGSAESVTTEGEQIETDTGILIPDQYKRIRASLYLAGASLTIAGAALESSKSENIIWEIPTGLAIIAGTFIYDKYFHKPNKE
ncbi:hypothetical protein KKF86_03230 [bacterium]|nr:hypothetical protein [bacterium]